MKGSFHFALRKLKNNRGSIALIYDYARRKQLRYSTKIILDCQSHWNQERRRVRNLLAVTDSHKINSRLDQLSAEIQKELIELGYRNPDYTLEDAKEVLDVIFGKAKKKKKKKVPTLLECYKWYIDYFSKNPNPTTKKPLTDGTVRAFKVSKNIFKEYSDLVGGVNYSDISMEFYESFVAHLQDKNFSNNYIANHIKNLKTILNYSFSRGYHTNTTHKRREFAKPTESVHAIYLSTKELEKIKKLDLPPGQSHSRDLFLIGAYTGLRVSDFNRLSKDNLQYLNNQYFFQIESQKTSEPLLIPCHPVVLEVIKKYDFSPPPSKTEQHINRDLKIIGKKAKLNEVVSITKTVGGKRKTEKFKKHDLISTHTARRSFCTNAYKAGMPTLDIMTISGHQTERVFYEYIKASSLERASQIAKHPFFN